MIGGSPGSGKSTLCRNLKRRWEAAPLINFGALRVFHLDPAWTRANDHEAALAFDHLRYIVRSYAAHGYTPVIVEDVLDHRLTGAACSFAGLDYRVLTLLASDELIATRLRNRGEGWPDVDGAVEWNREVRHRLAVAHESRLDTTQLDPPGVADAAIRLLAGRPDLADATA